jgi:hypothetical protein
VLAGSNNRAPVIVIIVPQPLVARFGPSSAPVTTQAILSVVANEEQPTISTHFGQGGENESVEPELERPIAKPVPRVAPLDVVEPFEPVAPAEPGDGQPAPVPGTARSRWSWPGLSDPGPLPVLDFSVADLWSGSRAGPWRSADHPGEVRLSCDLSTLFGAAAVAAGGYHLVLRPWDRFRGRWIPGRTETKRSRFRFPIG